MYVPGQKHERGTKTDVLSLLADLKACSRTRNLESGKQIHADAKHFGHDSDNYIATALVNMYAKCGSMVDALAAFSSMKCPDVVAWNVLLLGYADNGQSLKALELFRTMRNEGLAGDSITYVAAIKAYTSLAVKEGPSVWADCREWGKEIHALAIENGSGSNIYLQNTLIDMYSRCGSMIEASLVFNRMKHPDVVSWNTLILGYADNGQGLVALDLFTRMKIEGPVAPDYVTLLAVLKACTSLLSTGDSGMCACKERGKEIYNLAVEIGCASDISVQSSLIDMYAKCGSMWDARQVFDSIQHPNVVAWTALILGYAENGQGVAALDMFTKMRSEGVAPDSVMFAAALAVCSLLGALDFGRILHSEIESGNYLDLVLVNCLVDFYAKCGSLVEARRVFDVHVKTGNLITWSALLAGYSSCGDYESVFELVKGMQDAGFQPNSVTLLSILTCCSHAGLVAKGKECFEVMDRKYGIIPTVEHYNCMVDMFGRANKLDDAVALLRMPCNPDYVTWTTALGACRRWKNMEMGRLVFQSSIFVNDKDVAVYVLMGQIYGSRGMLQEQEMVMVMRTSFRNN